MCIIIKNILNMKLMIDKLDLNMLSILASFLKPHEIKTLGRTSKYVYNNCRNFMTYSYREYDSDKSYLKLNTAKWIVHECDRHILSDCINKHLTIVNIFFKNKFNKSIEALGHCNPLREITFGIRFNQSIETLANCTNLQQITFGHYFNQPIAALSHCINLRQITFGYLFNQPIEALAGCTTLRQITFNKYSVFDQPINTLSHCTNLRQITFGKHFNKPFESLAHCTNLQQITFGLYFNQPVDSLAQTSLVITEV